MALLETATTYILDLLTENEELKKFPKEFVNESVKWVKSWFLKPEDPKTNAKLEDPNKSMEVKKDIIQDKLDDLKDNPQFIKELTERLAAFEQHKTRLKNVVVDADIDIKGSVHIGDKGSPLGDNYDEKNIIKGGTIKAGGDFRLGDDVVQGNQIINNYHGYDESKLEEKFLIRKAFEEDTLSVFKELENHVSQLFSLENPNQNLKHLVENLKKVPPLHSSLKSELQNLIIQEKIGEAIDSFLEAAEQNDLDVKNELLLLYARYNRISKSDRQNLVSTSDANIERNRINAALTDLIEGLKI
jgi:hypothetical protein